MSSGPQTVVSPALAIFARQGVIRRTARKGNPSPRSSSGGTATSGRTPAKLRRDDDEKRAAEDKTPPPCAGGVLGFRSYRRVAWYREFRSTRPGRLPV